jgi:hypothetical protein
VSASATVEEDFTPGGLMGCEVYVDGKYRGCLVVHAPDRTYRLLRDIDSNVGAKRIAQPIVNQP